MSQQENNQNNQINPENQDEKNEEGEEILDDDYLLQLHQYLQEMKKQQSK